MRWNYKLNTLVLIGIPLFIGLQAIFLSSCYIENWVKAWEIFLCVTSNTAKKLLWRIRNCLEEKFHSKKLKIAVTVETLTLNYTDKMWFYQNSILHTVPVELNSTVHCRENWPSEFVFPFGKRLRQTAQYVTISEGCISVHKVFFFFFPPDREVLEGCWKTLGRHASVARGEKKMQGVSCNWHEL